MKVGAQRLPATFMAVHEIATEIELESAESFFAMPMCCARRTAERKKFQTRNCPDVIPFS
jgi:hypothetical protein